MNTIYEDQQLKEKLAEAMKDSKVAANVKVGEHEVTYTKGEPKPEEKPKQAL